MTNRPLIGIIMGSDSDYPILEPAIRFLESLKISHEIRVLSAHRTPDQTQIYIQSAKSRGLKVIIAAAGGAAHLPGVAASLTDLPVIGIPIKTRNFNGIDSLLSIIEMPRGIPVATVGVNNAENAAILACQILGLSSAKINKKIERFRKQQTKTVLKKDKNIQKTIRKSSCNRAGTK